MTDFQPPPPPPPGQSGPPGPGYWQASDGNWYPPQGSPQFLNRGTNTLAIVSLVASLIWVCGAGSIAAVITGHMSLKQIKETGEEGKGLAIAGLVIGYIGVALLLVYLLAIVAVGVLGTEAETRFQEIGESLGSI